MGVVEISGSGNTVTVTAKSAGTAAITAAIDGVSAVCSVTVTPPCGNADRDCDPCEECTCDDTGGGGTPEIPDAPAVGYVIRSGLMNGNGNGKFGPGDGITREQLDIIYQRYDCRRSQLKEEEQ